MKTTGQGRVSEAVMIVDSHTHALIGKGLEALVATGGRAMKRRLEAVQATTVKKPQTADIAVRLAQMDRCGIDCQLATLVPSLNPNNLSFGADRGLRASRIINEGMARITKESGGRILCAGNIYLDGLGEEGLREMERAIEELGLRGFNIPTHVRGKPLDAPEFASFWAKVAEMDVPVYLHPADPVNNKGRRYEADYTLVHTFGWPFETTLAMCRLVFSGLMEQFENLKIVTHHLGGMIPFYWGRIEERFIPEFETMTGVALKRPLREYFSRFYYDTAVGDNKGALRCAYELFGSERLLLATDAPFGPGNGDEIMESYPKIIRDLGLPERDTENILGDNARRLLKIH